MIAAIILAAGKGIRFGSKGLPKQFSEIAGIPLFILSTRIYADLDEIDKIIVVANPELADLTTSALKKHGLLDDVTLVEGGDTRQASVQNAAAAIGNGPLSSDDFVILHNAVSPNTPPAFVRACLAETKNCDAVQACVPDTRTVFQMDSGFVSAVLPRSDLAYNCDPTVYRGDVFGAILAAQKKGGMLGDTTLDTALQLGYRIRLLQSDYENIKITNVWDLEAVRAAIRIGRNQA